MPLCILVMLALLTTGCSSTKRLSLDNTFPVPLMQKVPLDVAIYLDEALRTYSYSEVLSKNDAWHVELGPVQEALFTNLGAGVFRRSTLTDSPSIQGMDAVLQPSIQDMQFSLPKQTRSNFYEVWIRYQFKMTDRQGDVVAEWTLPAYGKASNRDYGSSAAGVEAAAIAACRDAMAFFAINFDSEASIAQWLAANATQNKGEGESANN